MIFISCLAGLLLIGIIYEQVSRQRDDRRPVPGQMIEVGGYRLHVTDRGEGGPPVVLVHGAGDCSYSWKYICDNLAKFTRVITYDRPGMGSSNSGPALSPTHSVHELNTLLQKLEIPGPYILAGHSLGGLIVRLYAYEYPEKVAGMVFLDSTHEFLMEDAKFQQSFAFLGVALKLFRVLSIFGIPRFLGNVLGTIPMFINEHKYYRQQLIEEDYKQWKGYIYRMFAGKSAGAEFVGTQAVLKEAANRLKEFPNTPPFGDLPIAVVNNPGFGEGWTEMQKELASRSTNYIHQTSDRKGHSLQMPRPEYVINAIRHVVEQAREREGQTLELSTAKESIG